MAGALIVTDTKMAMAGINKPALHKCGGEVHCFMSDEEVVSGAAARGVTRAAVSMEKACQLPQPLIIAIGNAPTALLRLKELIDEGRIAPKLIIGVPVGFVNVVESKEIIKTSDERAMTGRAQRRQNVAAAILMHCSMTLFPRLIFIHLNKLQ
jgi:precorrin-8X/cobalt-precorrin-8 methylmutase